MSYTTKIDELKAQFSSHGGESRANRFFVTIDTPAGVNNSRDIGFFVEGVNLPGRNISTTEFSDIRETMKNPYTFIDSDVSMNVINTNDFFTRSIIDSWMMKVFDVEFYQVGWKEDYRGTVTINVEYGTTGTLGYGVVLENAFPITLGDVALAASDSGLSISPVTFAYDRYRVNDLTGSFTAGAYGDTVSETLAVNQAIARQISTAYNNTVGPLA